MFKNLVVSAKFAANYRTFSGVVFFVMAQLIFVAILDIKNDVVVFVGFMMACILITIAWDMMFDRWKGNFALIKHASCFGIPSVMIMAAVPTMSLFAIAGSTVFAITLMVVGVWTFEAIEKSFPKVNDAHTTPA